MTSESTLIDAALRAWKLNVDRVGKFFSALSEEQLQQEIAPGKNRLIYLWGHLAAVDDALLPLLGFGERLHPELDAIFLSNPDRSVPQTLSGAELKRHWEQIHNSLWASFLKLSAAEWEEKHTAVSAEDFAREPHRNRFAVLLGRTAHLAYHSGQAKLAEQRSK